MRRVGPAIALYFLAPLVAEFLLGDFPVTMLGLVLLLGPMYGGGAILIREVVRRTGRGWPSIVLLGLAYGIVEEAFTTESLFDPDYVNAHLLDKGFVPALGIAIPWTIFVLTIHTVWSIGAPIALAEGLTPTRRTTPWLRTPGLVTAAVLFTVGSAATAIASYHNDRFVAPWPRLLIAGLITAALMVVALRLPRRVSRPAPAAPPVGAASPVGAAPSPWLVLGAALAAGGLFMVADKLPTAASVAIAVLDLTAAVLAVATCSRRPGWDGRHRLALASAALLVYAGHSFTTHPLSGDGPVVTPVSHAVFAAAAVALIAVEARRLSARDRQEPAAVGVSPVPEAAAPAGSVRD
jgi:hypothetical protein